MRDVKINPCNKCWRPASITFRGENAWYRCTCTCDLNEWLTPFSWNANNPLAEKPVESKAEPLLACWCKENWIRVGPEFVHPLNDCVMDGRRLTGKQIRFLFGENPRVKDLEGASRILGGAINSLRDEIASLESQLTQERMAAAPLRGDISILRAERDALQAKLDAIPPDKSAKLAEELAALHRENYRHLRMLACVLDKK